MGVWGCVGMKMLSIQEVEQYGFTLYFLAFTGRCVFVCVSVCGCLGMKMLSIQEVEQYGFTLYFLAFTGRCVCVCV